MLEQADHATPPIRFRFLSRHGATTASTVPEHQPRHRTGRPGHDRFASFSAAPAASGRLDGVVIAAALPVILLVTLVIVMLAPNYNFLNWME